MTSQLAQLSKNINSSLTVTLHLNELPESVIHMIKHDIFSFIQYTQPKKKIIDGKCINKRARLFMHQLICVSKETYEEEKQFSYVRRRFFINLWSFTSLQAQSEQFYNYYLVLTMLKMCLRNCGELKSVDKEFLILH